MNFPFAATQSSAILNRNLEQRTIVIHTKSQFSTVSVKQHFSKFGKIEKIHSLEDKQTHFILFNNKDQATTAADATHENLNAEIFMKAKVFQTTKQIYLKQHDYVRAVFIVNIPLDADERIIEQEFSSFGQISYVRLIKTISGDLKGYGYVSFRDDDSYRAAVLAYIKTIEIKTNNVRIIKSLPESEIQKQKLQNLQMNQPKNTKGSKMRVSREIKESQKTVEDISKCKFAHRIDENLDIDFENQLRIPGRTMKKKIQKFKKQNVDVLKGVVKFTARVKKHLDEVLFQKPSQMKARRDKRRVTIESNRKKGAKLHKYSGTATNNVSQIIE